MEIRPILSALLRSKTGAILVALQVAISLAILSNALHIVNVRQAVSSRPSGIDDEASLFYIKVRHLVKSNHNEQMALQKAETATLRTVAGVASVAFASQMPMSSSGSTTSVAIDPRQIKETAGASFYFSPDSLVKTFGLKLLEGRDFRPDEVIELDNDADADADRFPKSVIVTRALAQKAWPGASSVVGKTLYFGTGADAKGTAVVGVVERLQSQSAELGEQGEYSAIVPLRLSNGFGTIYAIRAEKGQRERVMKEAEAALRRDAANPVLLRSKTVDADRKQRYRADNALSWMLVTVSVLLLLITASGIVGMASLWVTQRRKQIGVRRALGARRIDILRYFITENFLITSMGVAGGVLAALGLNQLLVAHLEMARLPLPYLLGGTAVFWALGVIAVYGPAWRAASISPALATRST
jgi:putative ABC transport system permease protein